MLERCEAGLKLLVGRGAVGGGAADGELCELLDGLVRRVMSARDKESFVTDLQALSDSAHPAATSLAHLSQTFHPIHYQQVIVRLV